MGRHAALALVAALGLWACGSAAAPLAPAKAARRAGSPCGRVHRAPRRYDHVIWVVMENHALSQIIGSSDAPYLNALARECGLATNYHGVAHPSLPNYIALTSGSTQGITDDGDPSSHPLAVPSIFSQVGWRALEDAMPTPCDRSDSGEYAPRHNPAVYYTNLRDCASHDVPLGSTPDLRAKFTFVTPDLIHDMHDGTVAQGDTWLSTFLPKVFASRQYRAGRTAVYITWDEDDDNHGNVVPALVIAPSVRRGARSSVDFSHFSLLRTTEQQLGLPPLAGAANAASMRRPFGI